MYLHVFLSSIQKQKQKERKNENLLDSISDVIIKLLFCDRWPW